MKPKKNILVCPLDWGLGHATRCVPIIKALQQLSYNVIIGADKNPLVFLKQEFPELTTVIVPGYDVTYNEKGSSFKLFYESVRFYNYIKKEQNLLHPIIEKYNIDVIISDNRYGLWSKKIKSILITHQLFVKAPFGESLAHKKIHTLIKKFDECWIPDTKEQPNLSGDLSHLEPLKSPHQFIGPLSRFDSLKTNNANYKYDVFAIISGPEPQRTIFEEIILEQLQTKDLKAVVVRGLPNNNKTKNRKIPDQICNNVKIFDHLPTTEFSSYFEECETVICRSGYSSIMDLITLQKKAILIPTPGQTEQEYLAQYHSQQNNFYTQSQNKFDLEEAISKAQIIEVKEYKNTKLSTLLAAHI